MEEMNAFKQNCTRKILDLPKDKKTIGCKWVFSIKCKVGGNTERYKDMLVARGFTQTYEINCQETFAQLLRLTLLECSYILLIIQII